MSQGLMYSVKAEAYSFGKDGMGERETDRELVVGPNIKIGNVEKVEKSLEPPLDCRLT